MTESLIRTIEVTEVDAKERTITGVFAPYDEVIEFAGAQERYERGAFAPSENVPVHYEHDIRDGALPYGVVTNMRDTDAGMEMTARFFDTAKGNELYAIVKDGYLAGLSANFVPTQMRSEGDVTVYEKAELLEVSIVKKGAYPSAKISEVRNDAGQNKNKGVLLEHTIDMTNIETIDSEARSGLENLERRFEVLSEKGNSNLSVSKFRSAGEAVKALAENDETVKSEIRAYTGAVLADSHTSNDWKNDLLRIVDGGRPVLNLFSRGPLGNTGNSVEYPKVASTTGDVALQAAEGDNLAYLELAVTTATAPVKTYGGYSELSRQVIERSDVSYLDTVLKMQAASYSKVTNAAVLSAIGAATPQTGTSFTLSSATAASFIGAAVDGVQKINDNGLGANAEFIVVSADVWAKMATLVDSANRPVFNINGDGSNTIGNANVRGIAGSLAGMPVVVAPGFSAKTLYVASSDAVMTWENAGAPVRLQDENIINLTKQFSLYGYMAVGVKNANGLVKATIA